MPNKAPYAAFKFAVVTIAFFGVLAWLLVLGGVSALEHVCPNACRSRYGLAWFIIWCGPIMQTECFCYAREECHETLIHAKESN